MAVEERVSRLEGEHVGMSARLSDMRSDMNARFDQMRSEMNARFDDLRSDMNRRNCSWYWCDYSLAIGLDTDATSA